jgi:hypothetical protein
LEGRLAELVRVSKKVVIMFKKEPEVDSIYGCSSHDDV